MTPSTGRLLEIVKRSVDAVSFIVPPQRRIVGRTFDWFNGYRRLSKDDEEQTDRSDTRILVARIPTETRRTRLRMGRLASQARSHASGSFAITPF